MSFKPRHYNSVSPYFVSSDPQRLVQLIVDVFGGEQLRLHHRPDGSIMHTEVRLDDSIIMIGGTMVGWSPNELLVHVYVPDVRATFQRALDRGCTSIEAPVQKDDTDMRGMFSDFDGNVWAVGTQVGEKAH